MEDGGGPGGGTSNGYGEPELRSETWHLPASKQTIEIWQPATAATSSDATEPGAGLYELGAVDFSQHTDGRKTTAAYRKANGQSDQENQTVTLFDLNQNHETKVLLTENLQASMPVVYVNLLDMFLSIFLL